MRISKTAFWRGLVILAAFSIIATLGYRSIRKTCCTEELSGDELRHVVREAENGNVAAMKRLFFFFSEGEDPVNATLWLKRAADAGDAEAEEFMYARLFARADVKERALAVRYLRSAAEHGSPTAQQVLGESYRDGSGVPRNLEYAKYWLRRSARSGDPEGVLALCNLAVLQRDKQQCEECLRMETRAIASLDADAYLTKELLNQHQRIARQLKNWK